jgi:hypothetical protein
MYNCLKMLTNQVHNLESKKWSNHEVVKLMVRSFTSRNATLISLVRENPRYKKMTPKEVFGKPLSHEMMVRDSMYKDLAQGNVSINEPQLITFKVTNEKEAILKRKCDLGPFLVVLVIKCSTHQKGLNIFI